jgi:hypothetical protein
MPNLRQAGAAPFVPVVLVQENWVGSGNVGGKTPSPIAGGGTWQIVTAQAVVVYGGGVPRASVYLPDGEPITGEIGVFRHSVAFTNATISTTPYIDVDASSSVRIWARSSPAPNAEITNGYWLYIVPNNLSLSKRVSGVDTEIGYANNTNANNTLTSLTVSGSTITVKIAGTTVITVNDSTFASAGYFGCEVAMSYGTDSWVPNSVGPITIQTA